LTFVSLHENGKPQRVDAVKPEIDIEFRRFNEGKIRHEERKDRLRKDRK
jgi:acyl-CoA hydrolase